ncbi:MAG: DUF465 domain-containing protein [Pseudomonadota bacterium]
MSTLSEDALKDRLQKLVEEHRDLDVAITAMQRSGNVNQLQVQRMKKRKLVLKDQIAAVNDQIIPDIIA